MARDARHLEGNGAHLVRERALASSVQKSLERLYQLDQQASVDDFLQAAGDGERESVLVREADDGAVEIAVRVPALSGGDLDGVCQLIEGVSHFVYLAERARAERSATQLELELQAEVDKYVVLGGAIRGFDEAKSAALRSNLFESVRYADAAESDEGERYRVANELANRFVRRLEREYVAAKRFVAMREELRTFYRMGQEAKLRVGREG
jgi:hypothetical protein